MRHLILVALMFVATSCRDECNWKTDPGRCEGNSTVICAAPGPDQLVPVRWMTTPCNDQVCVQSGPRALCALDASVSPLCDGGSDDTCDGRTRVACELGYEVYRAPCLSCRDAGLCEGGPSSGCAVDAQCASELFCRDAGHGAYCTRR